jgi:heavy metal sensor kinase
VRLIAPPPRLPIRVRLAAWYALLLAAILIALGVFIVVRLRVDLRETIDSGVRGSMAKVSANYRVEGTGGFREVSAAALPRSGSASQVIDPSGRVVVSFGGATANASMISRSQRTAALAGHGQLVEAHLGRPPRLYRVLARGVDARRGRQVVVVAESLQETEEAVRHIRTLFLLAAPVALAIAAFAGWWLARKALHPVELMTRKAEQIGIDRLDERLAATNPNDELGHLAGTLNAMLDRLQAGVDANRRLVADASHELRTPLAAMRAEVDVSLRRDTSAPDDRAVLESVREEIDRMSRSVDNLLTLAQRDEGHLTLLLRPLDLRKAARAATKPFQGLAATKGVSLRSGGHTAVAVGDAQRVQLALTNLIDNAIKFTAQGGKVDVSSWRNGEQVGVTVKDNGTGIPLDALDHLFDRFYRATTYEMRLGSSPGVSAMRPADHVPGSGLGLAIVKEIAEAHGGTVSVQTEEGRGSAFSLALPALNMPPR